jgi:hypothetical protein
MQAAAIEPGPVASVGAAGPACVSSAHVSLQLSGLYCAACAGLIEAALRAAPGVREVSVNASARLATVGWQPAAR